MVKLPHKKDFVYRDVIIKTDSGSETCFNEVSASNAEICVMTESGFKA